MSIVRKTQRIATIPARMVRVTRWVSRAKRVAGALALLSSGSARTRIDTVAGFAGLARGDALPLSMTAGAVSLAWYAFSTVLPR